MISPARRLNPATRFSNDAEGFQEPPHLGFQPDTDALRRNTRWRNGYRDRSPDTRLATLNLRVPKPRQVSCFLCFLDAGKTAERIGAGILKT
jgi:hypothetical protein